MRLQGTSGGIVGEEVELRPHSRESYPLYAEWYGDPEIWRLTSWKPAPLDRREVEQLFEERESSGTEESFAIHPRGSGEPVGVIGLLNLKESSDSASLSVIVGNPGYRNRGYGTEAIRLILRHGFEDLGLNRIGLSVFDFNERAIALYESLGFKRDGRIRKAVKRDGRARDAILMALHKSEWREMEGREKPKLP